MVTVVKGDLLDAKETIIAHQVNCQKRMNSGVAKAIRENIPLYLKGMKIQSQCWD